MNNKEQRHIKRPIRRTLLIYSIIFLLLLSCAITMLCYYAFSKALYSTYNNDIKHVITYVENNIDSDDLRECLEKRETSLKYQEAQQFLNGIIDDLGLEYLYLVIPTEDLMINVISATSQEERDNGEADMPLYDTSDWYSKAELKRFKSAWNRDDIVFFEESSEWGSFYTGAKAFRDSNGETVCLICVDLSSEDLHNSLGLIFAFSALVSTLGIGLFALFIFVWIRKDVTSPLLALENSAKDFAHISHKEQDINLLKYEPPVITTQNEVQSLSDAITLMAKDARKRIEEIKTNKNMVVEAKSENAKLQKEAEASRKIAELSQSVSSLLSNMPVMTFSKDVENGKYLACNKLFCEYANKNIPEEVVGLTDHEIFDKKTADHFVEDDKKAIEMEGTYVFYEDVLDAVGKPRQFQTTKLKFTDTTGRVCLLGMCIDVTDLYQSKKESVRLKEAYEESKSESVTYSNIARALSLDYKYLYYVDLETDSFIEYHSDVNKTDLLVERRGEDFFNQSRIDAKEVIYTEDQEEFLDSFHKDKILEALDEDRSYTITYRMLSDNHPTYFNMKISRMEDDDKHIIVGVSNIDAQMRMQEVNERLKQESITYNRISALAGNYICIYTVDPVTDNYLEYSATKDYEGLGLDKEGKDFFKKAIKDGNKNVYAADIDRFNSAFTKENVLNSIKNNGIFVLDYRLMILSVPTYVSLKAAIVNEKDGPQIIIGISNIDATVKREQEYAYKLSIERDKANIDALTGVKNKHSYVDVETELNKLIEEKEKTEFGVVVFDVNGLKTTNDRFGHQMGDILIKDASKMICDIFKHSPVYRVGGDEFCVIAQDEDYHRLDDLVSKMEQENKENIANGGITVACGYAKYSGERSVALVFQKADTNMYENKKMLKELMDKYN